MISQKKNIACNRYTLASFCRQRKNCDKKQCNVDFVMSNNALRGTWLTLQLGRWLATAGSQLIKTVAVIYMEGSDMYIRSRYLYLATFFSRV